MQDAPEQGATRKLPSIIVGGIQFTPDDPLPSAIVAVAYPSRQKAEEAARTLLSVHNGVKPFQTGPDIYVGDTNVKVRVRPSQGRLLVQVYAYAEPKHLTCAFYAAGHVDIELYKAFRDLVELQRTYTLTVAAGDEILVKELDLLKYVLDDKGVKV